MNTQRRNRNKYIKHSIGTCKRCQKAKIFFLFKKMCIFLCSHKLLSIPDIFIFSQRPEKVFEQTSCVLKVEKISPPSNCWSFFCSLRSPLLKTSCRKYCC